MSSLGIAFSKHVPKSISCGRMRQLDKTVLTWLHSNSHFPHFLCSVCGITVCVSVSMSVCMFHPTLHKCTQTIVKALQIHYLCVICELLVVIVLNLSLLVLSFWALLDCSAVSLPPFVHFQLCYGIFELHRFSQITVIFKGVLCGRCFNL